MLRLIWLAILSAFVLGGCASGNARYVETGNQENIVSVGEVDIQDIQKAAAGMLDSLLETGTLKRAARTPALLAIDKVVNDTSSQFDTGELLYRMREQLVNSGQAQVVTVWGANAEDATAKDAATRDAFLTGSTTGGVQKPDFSLTGKITQIKRQAGQTRQTTYTFRLTLTSMTTGAEVWTKNVDVTKQGVRNSVGW
jgi:uncharacterized protein (TIGR02722 family)